MSEETSKTADSNNMSNKHICRTCTNTETSMVSLFIYKIDNEILKDILIYCTSLKVSEDDLLPQMICNSCLELLVNLYRFRRKCLKNDLKLRSALDEQQSNHSNCSLELGIEDIDSCKTKTLSNKASSENCKNKSSETQLIKNTSKLQCDLCGKTFTKKSSLIYHLRIHSGQRNFFCSECDRSFVTSSQLSAHQRSHNGYKPHICKICNKSFSKSSNLNVHLLMHRNEKRFTCTVCEKKFSQKIHLISHQNLHSGYRPFICQCGATFVSETNLKRHSNTHKGKKNYLCNFCGNQFLSCNDLNRHLLTHNNEKNEIICDICFKHFTRLASLHRHRIKFHK